MKTPREAALEVAAYAVSFGAFYLFVFVGLRWPSCAERQGGLGRLMRLCVGGQQAGYSAVSLDESQNARPAPQAQTFMQTALHLCACALGIQVSYLCWGVMQVTADTWAPAVDSVTAVPQLAHDICWMGWACDCCRTAQSWFIASCFC